MDGWNTIISFWDGLFSGFNKALLRETNGLIRQLGFARTSQGESLMPLGLEVGGWIDGSMEEKATIKEG